VGVVGFQAGSSGTARVDGSNSTWTIGNNFVVGFAGNGALTISNGGLVSVGGAGVLIANDPGSIGKLSIGAEDGSPAVAAGTLDTALVQFGDGLGALQFNHTETNYVFSPVIGGNGAINQLAGVTRLTADSSAFTGSTNISGGTLLVDGNIGGGPVSVMAGGTLGGMGTLGGPVTVDNGGTLQGVQGQTLSMQSLNLAAGSNVNVTLTTPGGAALFNVANNLTLDGTLNITSGGGFGPGVYRLMNYGGALTDNGMIIGATPSGAAAGDFAVQTAVAGQVNLVNNMPPTTTFWDGDGAGNANNNMVDGGSGVWTAASTNWTTYNGATNGAMQPQPGFVIFQGTAGTVTADASAGALAVTGMQFASDGYQITGAPITLADLASIIRVGDGSAGGATYKAIIASELTGSGGLNKADLGTLILTGANSYTGGTTISGGTLQIGNGGTSGSVTGNVVNNSVLAFARSDATTFGGTISGSGAVKLLSGDVTLTAASNYAGGTSIAAGSMLRLGNGGTTGSIAGNVMNNGVLAFNRSNDWSFAGVVSGTGNLRQIGAGKTELTGDSSGFTGTTSVESGILAVNGKLGGTLNVLAAGRLQGTGTVGNTVVNGTIAPGNSIGTLNVAGNIAFNAGSIYEVEVNAAGQSDKIVASGTATINGGSVKVLAGMGNYAPATTYTILTANGGRSGTFTGGVTSNLAFLDPSLSYDANNVYLTMTRNAVSFQNAGITANQIATGGGVESLGLGNPVYNAVLNLSAPQAQYAFDQLSGEIHASAKTALIEDSRFVRNAINDRIRAAFDGVGASKGGGVTYVDGKPVAVAATTDRLAVWGQGFGSWGHTDSDGNAARLNRKTGGFFVGADAPVFDTWRFGAVAGYSATQFDVKDRRSTGTSDNYHLGLYGGTQWGDLAFRTGAAYTWHDISTSRNVSFPGFSNGLKGAYNAATAQVFGELAYGFNAGGARFEPFANLAYVNLHTDGFRERGGAAALTSPSSNTDATFTTLGLRGSTTFDMGGATLTAKGMLGWRHAFGDVTPLSTMRFAGGGNAFSIGGVPIARDAAVIEAGLDYAITPNATVGVTYGGQFGSGIADQSVKANFNVKF
jgi:outer membrane autotransporter protein